jgi:hypothetical protein
VIYIFDLKILHMLVLADESDYQLPVDRNCLLEIEESKPEL